MCTPRAAGRVQGGVRVVRVLLFRHTGEGHMRDDLSRGDSLGRPLEEPSPRRLPDLVLRGRKKKGKDD